MNIQQTIIGTLLLANTLEKQKNFTEPLLPEFFTDGNEKIIAEIKSENSQNRLSELKLLNFDENYLLLCISQSTYFTNQNEIFNKLKDEYLATITKNISESKTFALAKSKLIDAEQKAQRLDYSRAMTIQEVITDSVETSTHDLYNLPKTGFVEFDKEFQGFKDSELITIGGYTGAGKSTLLFSLVRNLAIKNQTLIFNLEMDNYTMSARILSALSGLSFIYCLSLGNEKTQKEIGEYFSEKYAYGISQVENFKLKMIDNQFSISEILTSIRKEHKENGLKFVFIDYVQLIKTDSKKATRYLEIAEITRDLKLLAKELKIVIIILAQLGRGSISKDEPGLEDLKESSSIADDSDSVILLYKGKNDTKWLKLAKNRMFGKFTKAMIEYNPKTQSYE
jgi:replicative DNA helicase